MGVVRRGGVPPRGTLRKCAAHTPRSAKKTPLPPPRHHPTQEPSPSPRSPLPSFPHPLPRQHRSSPASLHNLTDMKTTSSSPQMPLPMGINPKPAHEPLTLDQKIARLRDEVARRTTLIEKSRARARFVMGEMVLDDP